MIYESGPWKQDLEKLGGILKKRSQQKRITENACQQIEKSVFISAFIIRKLIDCASKVSDAVDGYSFQVMAFRPLRNIDRMHRRAEFEDYDWNHPQLLTAPGKDICNWLIHSYNYFFARARNNVQSFFYVCSDYDRNKYLYKVSMDDWMNYIDFVASDSISEMRSVYDEKKKDYIYKLKRRNNL